MNCTKLPAPRVESHDSLARRSRCRIACRTGVRRRPSSRLRPERSADRPKPCSPSSRWYCPEHGRPVEESARKIALPGRRELGDAASERLVEGTMEGVVLRHRIEHVSERRAAEPGDQLFHCGKTFGIREGGCAGREMRE